MGWRTRPTGWRYLDRYRRVIGQRVKEYLVFDDPSGCGVTAADFLRRV